MAKQKSRYSRNGQPDKVQMDYERLKLIAQDYYVSGLITEFKKIAERVGVHEETVARWCEKGEWDAAKKDNALELAKITNAVIRRASELSRKLDSADDVKELRDLTAILKEFRPKDSLTDYVNAFTAFVNWLGNQGFKEETLRFYELQDTFLMDYIEKKTS